MPSFISVGGEWFAAKEKTVVTPKDGAEPYIYEGPDREAAELIKQETGGQSDHIGMKVQDDPQLMQLARDRGLTLEQYLEQHKPTPKQEEIRKEEQAKVVTHVAPPPKPGVDTGTKGGFYDSTQSDPVKEFIKK